MAGRLIVTNGDAAVERLRAAGIEARFLPWRDALHDGPVPAGLLLEALALVRAQFFAKAFRLGLSDVIRQFSERNALIRSHGQFDRVELWFEHDLYDQLQLIEIITFFSDEGRTEGVALVQADDYLGTLPADAIQALAARARPLSPAQAAEAQRAWAAFTAASPVKLAALSRADRPGLPYLAPALRRLVQELPALGSGLSLTEERALTVLTRGPRTVAELFAATQTQESAHFLGDTAFFRRLDGLAFVPRPLIAGLEFPSTRCAGGPETADYRAYAASRVRLTDAGRMALSGRFDHAAENAVERWLGGTLVTPNTPWRRDRHGGVTQEPGTS